jgi:hypothetical protein
MTPDDEQLARIPELPEGKREQGIREGLTDADAGKQGWRRPEFPSGVRVLSN